MESLDRSALLALPLITACAQEITEPDECLEATKEISEHIGLALTKAPQLINHQNDLGCVHVYLNNRSEDSFDDLNFIYDHAGEFKFMEKHDTGLGNILLITCDIDTASIKEGAAFDVYATDAGCETQHSFGDCIDQEKCLTKYAQTWEGMLPVQEVIHWDIE